MRRGLHRMETLGPHRPDPQGGVAQGPAATEQGLGAACPSSLQPGAQCPSPSGFQGDGDPGEQVGTRPQRAVQSCQIHCGRKKRREHSHWGNRHRFTGVGALGRRDQEEGSLDFSEHPGSHLSPLGGQFQQFRQTGGRTRLWDRGCPLPHAQQ